MRKKVREAILRSQENGELWWRKVERWGETEILWKRLAKEGLYRLLGLSNDKRAHRGKPRYMITSQQQQTGIAPEHTTVWQSQQLLCSFLERGVLFRDHTIRTGSISLWHHVGRKKSESPAIKAKMWVKSWVLLHCTCWYLPDLSATV